MADLASLFWQCQECGQIVTDLEKRSFVIPNLPCKGCGRSIGSYTPRTSLREGNKNTEPTSDHR